MDFLRFIIIFGIMFLIAIPLELNWINLVKFYDKVFSYPILHEGITYENLREGPTTKDALKIALKDPYGFNNEAETMLDDYLTYEGKIINLSIPLVIMPIPILFLFEDSFFINLGFYLFCALPAVMLLCRIKTFGSSNILPETGLGYEPLNSWKLLLISMVGVMLGLASIYFPNVPFHFSLVIISSALAFALIPLFPDYINKILPYEIRSEKGYSTLRTIVLIAFYIQMAIFVILSSNLLKLFINIIL